METYEIDTIKLEKEKAMRRYRTFRKIARTVRTLEIFIAITLVSLSVSYTSRYIPAGIELTGKVFRRVSSLLFSPHFVFLIGNAIVITLFANSSSSSSSSESSVSSDHVSAGNDDILAAETEFSGEKVVESPASETAIVPVEEKREKEVRIYRRTQSTVETMIREEEVVKKELRRSATEPRRKVESPARRRMCEEDDLSGEEFRRKVEEFIEKQQRFLREESQAVVVSL